MKLWERRNGGRRRSYANGWINTTTDQRGDMHTDMNKRERERFGRGLKFASTILLAAGMAVETENDEIAGQAIATFNLFLLSEYSELNDVFVQAVYSDLANVQLTIPDSLPPDFSA
jgi:hypothetical protein